MDVVKKVGGRSDDQRRSAGMKSVYSTRRRGTRTVGAKDGLLLEIFHLSFSMYNKNSEIVCVCNIILLLFDVPLFLGSKKVEKRLNILE